MYRFILSQCGNSRAVLDVTEQPAAVERQQSRYHVSVQCRCHLSVERIDPDQPQTDAEDQGAWDAGLQAFLTYFKST